MNLYEILGIGEVKRLPEIGFTSLFDGPQQVVADGSIEQQRVLRHIAHALPKTVLPPLA